MMVSRRGFAALAAGGAMARRPDQYARPAGIGGAGGFPSSSVDKAPLDLVSLQGTTFTAGVGQTVYNRVFAGRSYKVSLDFLTLVAPAMPFVKVSMIWKDKAAGTTLAVQHWFILITNVSPASSNGQVVGRGPAESGFLQVIVKNLDSTDITGDFLLVQSGLPQVTRHDWRSVSNNITGTYVVGALQAFSTPISDNPNNVIGFANVPVLAHGGGVLSRINGLYAGEVQLTVTSNPAVNSLELDVWGLSPEFSIINPPLLPPQTFTTKAFVTDLTLYRSPSLILITNNDGALDANVQYTMVPKEFAS